MLIVSTQNKPTWIHLWHASPHFNYTSDIAYMVPQTTCFYICRYKRTHVLHQLYNFIFYKNVTSSNNWHIHTTYNILSFLFMHLYCTSVIPRGNVLWGLKRNKNWNNIKNAITKCQSNSLPEGFWQEAKSVHTKKEASWGQKETLIATSRHLDQKELFIPGL